MNSGDAVCTRFKSCFRVSQIQVSVTDSNDSPPAFDSDVMTVVSIAEDAALLAEVTQLQATDPDSVGTLEYSIVEG